jgi:hypothetical protein
MVAFLYGPTVAMAGLCDAPPERELASGFGQHSRGLRAVLPTDNERECRGLMAQMNGFMAVGRRTVQFIPLMRWVLNEKYSAILSGER